MPGPSRHCLDKQRKKTREERWASTSKAVTGFSWVGRLANTQQALLLAGRVAECFDPAGIASVCHAK